MTEILQPGQGLLFMKVGIHAKETLEDIIDRKQKEFQKTGMIFWGYGGNTCHPTKHVQPFARQISSHGKDVILVMQKINSNHFAEPIRAEEYSDDGISWKPVPSGIDVLGSRYALVLEQLEFGEFDLDLEAMQVAVGPSRGCIAPDYLRGRVDKGCFEYTPGSIRSLVKDDRPISLFAKLQPPYAVHLK